MASCAAAQAAASDRCCVARSPAADRQPPLSVRWGSESTSDRSVRAERHELERARQHL